MGGWVGYLVVRVSHVFIEVSGDGLDVPSSRVLTRPGIKEEEGVVVGLDHLSSESMGRWVGG